MITESTAEQLENFIERHLPKLIAKSGLDLTMVSIGGKFNDEGVLLEIGLVPQGSSPERCKKFLVDREAEGADVRALSDSEAEEVDKKFDVRRSGVSKNKLKELAAALTGKYKQGEVYIGKKGSYAMLGYSAKREEYVLYAIEIQDIVFVSLAKLRKLTKA